MTSKEAAKIRSAYCNGYHYPFGGGYIEKCDMTEVNRHAKLLDEALKKAIPETPTIEGDAYDNKGSLIYDTWYCPNCNKSYEIDYDDYTYCPKCGQAINWSGVNLESE